ncbi:hypothetical protein BJY52DRAFT_1193932 [Lactarius psammicola]|nr:hypothetical protein BJY52DRAFT_1193932 [Lactarius psammicola]
MEQNIQPPSSPQHVPWSADPVPPTPAINPNDTGHLLAHITTFNKDPVPSQPYRAIMDAGFDPNTQPAPEITHQTQYGVRDDHAWLLSSSPLPPAGSAEMQGTAPNRHHILPPIETLAPLPEASFQSLQSSVQYTQASIEEVIPAAAPTRAGLSETTKRYIREASANLKAIRASRIPNCLPDTTRRIIQTAVVEREAQNRAPASPEVIFVRSSTADPCDVVIPASRPGSVASMWTHVTHETEDPESNEEFHTQFPELRVRDFIESITEALRAPVLTEQRIPSVDPSWDDEDNDLERIRNELMVELGRDVSDSQTGYANFYINTPLQLQRDHNFPSSSVGFNLSVGLVIAALDCGVEDQRGDLEQAGLTPSSWFRLASGVLGALARGALRSGGRKIQGRTRIDDDDDTDVWTLHEGLAKPVTQGGRIAAQANQIANFFAHYATADEPPLTDFYNSVLRIGQNHIEKVVRLKAAATYQLSTADAQGLVDMVHDDMARQTYEYMVTNPDARRAANQRSLDKLFVDAQEQLGPFISEWKTLYKHHMVQALKDDEEAREEAPPVMDPLLKENEGYIQLFAYNRVREIRDSIARTVTDPILDGDEISRARERIRLEHAEEIEAARRDTRAQISSEKKAWAVAYRDSVKLDWLTKAAEELGFVLISKDDAEEREGRLAKRHAGPVGKRERSCSRASNATPSEVPATPENRPRLLDTSRTPKARKTKGKRVLAQPRPLRSRSNSISSQPSDLSDVPDVDMTDIKKPLFFASSYPAITGISVPAEVRPSQAPEAPLRDPRSRLSEPATDISILVAPAPTDPVPDPTPPSRVLTPDSTRGVASSMHNPENAMADDLPPAKAPEAVAVPPALPSLQPIPLLPGLAEMLNALQANLMTSFTSQINVLSSRIDAQDELIRIRPQSSGKGKGKGSDVRAGPPQPPPAQGKASAPLPHASADSAPTPSTGVAPSQPTEVLPVPDPLPVPRPPPPSSAPRPPRAILPDRATWAGIVTPSNFAQNSAAKAQATLNANIVGRTPGGAVRKGRGATSPPSVENTEITIARGEGLADKTAEASLYKSNPGNIVQAARSAMERMSAQAPPVLYGRWSVNANSHNFVYVFAGIVPFTTILQFSKALVEPLGVGNPLPNKGWTFAQIRGVPTSDGAGVIHSSDLLLQEIRRVPFFTDAIFVSKPHWQLPVTSLAHATRGVVQLAFIDETGTRSIAAKKHGVGMFGSRTQFFLTGNKPYFAQCGRCHEVGHATNAPACKLGPNSVRCHICGGSHRGQDHGFHCKATTHVVAGQCNCRFPCLLCGGRHNARSPNCPVRGGFKPSPLADPSSSSPPAHAKAAPSGAANKQTPTDADGFTPVGKGGKDAAPSGSASRASIKRRRQRAKKAEAGTASTGLPTAGPSNPNRNGNAQGSSVMNVLFPEDVATITETIDAFRKLAYAVCDGSKEDLQRAMQELEGGWGVPTEHLDNLFSLPARYAVKHDLPLTIPQTEDSIARGGNGNPEEAAALVRAFRAAWGSSQPIHYVYHALPAGTRFATDDEVDARRSRQAKASDKMRQFNDAVQFTIDLSRSLFENNVTSRPLSTLESEVIVTTNSLENLFSLDNPGPIGDRVAESIKSHIQQDSARLFSLPSITSYA